MTDACDEWLWVLIVGVREPVLRLVVFVSPMFVIPLSDCPRNVNGVNGESHVVSQMHCVEVTVRTSVQIEYTPTGS